MNPFATRAAAAELARLLEEPGSRPASAAPGSPAALAGLAERVAAASPAPALRPEFRDALRTRLVAVATVQASTAGAPAPAAPVRTARPAAWRSAVAAGGLASVVAVAGVGVASEQSLPGDPFYGAKRVGESVQLRLAGSPADEGVTHLHHASTRLEEVAALATGRRTSALVLGGGAGPVAALAGAPDPALLTGALEDMDSSTRVGGALLVRAAGTGDEVPLDVLHAWSREQAAGLEALLPALPAGPRERAAVSLALVAAVVDQVLVSAGAVLDERPADGAGDPGDGLPAPQVAPLPSGTPDGAAPGTATTPGSPRPTASPGSGAAAGEEPTAPAQDPARAPQVPGTRLPTAPPALPPLLPLPTATLPGLPLPGLPLPAAPVLPAPVGPVPALPAPLPTLSVPALPLPAVPLPAVPLPDGPALPLPTLSAPALPLPGLPGS